MNQEQQRFEAILKDLQERMAKMERFFEICAKLHDDYQEREKHDEIDD